MQEGSSNNHALEKVVLEKLDWLHDDFMMAQKVHGSMLFKLRRILGDEEHCLHRALRFFMDTYQLYHVAETMEIAENKELYKETEKRLFKQFSEMIDEVYEKAIRAEKLGDVEKLMENIFETIQKEYKKDFTNKPRVFLDQEKRN
ncbi:hypothetical protein CEXT_411231 [Caerostris extrusa]|uniref:Hemerythrin-like domain-containing protein n=1 Tax=Caerostris extrusa TaxID=172846 RepID=A0AAV4XRX9_CAEEX|nr:hypothetical protein CEXT_411231 [Caerostris extrusa]